VFCETWYNLFFNVQVSLPFVIDRLRKSDVCVKFVTNTTKESLHSVHDRLTKLGFDVGQDEIFTSLTAARKFVERKSLRPLLLLEESAKEDFNGQQFLSLHLEFCYIHRVRKKCHFIFACNSAKF